MRLEGFEKRVEVGSREHVAKVIGGGAEFDIGRDGRKLLRIRITADADGTRHDYVMTYSRRRASNEAVGCAYARAYAPGLRRREVFSAGGGADWEEAEGVQHEGRLDNDIECYEGIQNP